MVKPVIAVLFLALWWLVMGGLFAAACLGAWGRL